MPDWTDGYVADIAYTYGYYAELNPLRTQLAFLNVGLSPSALGCHCELGFGQGLSVNIHAAASAQPWYATDFNPAHASFARSLAAASGAPARLYDEAFADFCHRADLPDFDSIGLHGIWSWINDENRAVIVDFARRKLKAGGVLYLSYNTQPGWAATVPVRDLLADHARVMATPGRGIIDRVDEAFAFAGRLFDADPAFVRANPQMPQRLQKIREHNANYLAHEYFNRDWHPMSFARMADWLASAKLDFACSAHYLDHFDVLNLSEAQRALLKDIPDSAFRQTVRDFCVNQQFRRDYWVKGARRANVVESGECLRRQRFVLAQPRDDVAFKVMGSLGEAMLKEARYAPVLDLLGDRRIRSLGEMEAALAQGVPFAQLAEAALILCGNGALMAAQDDATIERARPYAHRLNAALLKNAMGSGDITFLASPVTGGGVAVGRFEQLFLLARAQGRASPREWADYAWMVLSGQNQKILKAGKPLETAEENLATLNAQAEAFAGGQLPVLEALQVV